MTEQERQLLKVKVACCNACGGWLTQSCFPQCENSKESIKNFRAHLKAGDSIDVITVGEAMKMSYCQCWRLTKSVDQSAPLPEPEPTTEPPLARMRAEGYEYRIYDLEYAYLIAEPNSPESKELWASCEQVKANYHRDFPNRQLNPKPRPGTEPTGWAASKGPIGTGEPAPKKPRKPYTRKVKPAA